MSRSCGENPTFRFASQPIRHGFSHLSIRKEYGRTCERAGKFGKQIERCVIATFRIAERMGFRGTFTNGSTCCGLEIDHALH